MDLNDKIKDILVHKNISPSHFADEIGVQRSSISHILAGRNKPSLDIVQKIVRRYPDLGMDWILEDEDLPAIITEGHDKKHEGKTRMDSIPSESPEIKSKANGEVDSNVKRINSDYQIEKSIESILIFYSDGTFKQYISAK